MYLTPEDPELQALLARARDPATPTGELRRILDHPAVARLDADADADPYEHYDYPGHQTDLPARRVGYLVDLSQAVLRHPNVPRELLLTYARRGMGEQIARNSNVPPDVLEGLAEGRYGKQPLLTSAMLVANPATPASVLERVTRGVVRADVLEPVLDHPHASEAAREAALFLLGRPVVPGEATLRALATAGPDPEFVPSKHHDTALAVARCPATPAGVLADLLAAHPYARFELLAAVAAHPNADGDVLRGVVDGLERHLAGDRRRYERWWYAPLISTDPGKNPILALRANPAFTGDLPAPLADLLPILALGEQEPHRLARDPRTDPATLALLARDVDSTTRSLVAANPAAPAEALETLAPRAGSELRARHPYRPVHLALAANPAAPPAVLRRIHDLNRQARDPVYRRLLAENPGTPDDVRESLTVAEP